MKTWFKHAYGYINLDAENVYLTSSGNWAEARKLPEKTRRVSRKNRLRTISVLFFLTISFAGIALLIYANLLRADVGALAIGGSLFGAYQLYRYLSPEIGQRFRIPYTQIREIHIQGNQVEFVFLNGDGDLNRHSLQGIDEEGMAVLSKLQTAWLPSDAPTQE